MKTMKKEKRNQKIRELCKKGLTYQKLGKKFNISRQRAHQITKGNYYLFHKKTCFWCKKKFKQVGQEHICLDCQEKRRKVQEL